MASGLRIRDIIQRGTRANQPVATGTVLGATYSVSDEGVVERSDQTSWTKWALGFITGNRVKFPGQAYGPFYDAGNSGTALTLDFDNGNQQKLTLTGNVTLTLSNPVDGGRYVLKIATGAGSFTVTWPAAVLWPSGTAPTITATASKVDLVTMIYDANTTKYYASANQNY